MASLEKSRVKLADEYEAVQKKAFTKWINSHLEKAQDSIEDLFVDLRSGVRLLTLIEMFTGQKQPQEKGKMRVHHLTNVRSALSYLTDVKKIKLHGITAESIVDGKPTSTLGLVWMLILNFQLSSFVPQRKRTSREATPEVSMAEIKRDLLQWAKKATEGYEEVNVTNFSSSWNDGMAFCAIIDRHRPDLLDYDECDPDRPLDNIEKAFTVAEKELDVIRLIDPEDVSVEKPSEEPILMYVHSLRNKFKEMPPPHRRKGPPVSPEDYTAKHAALKAWMEGRRAQVMSRDFPLTADKVSKLLDDFRSQRAEEDSEKEQYLNEARVMAQELKVFEQKKKKDLKLPAIAELEMLWEAAMKESDDFEAALQKELDRLEKLDSLASVLKLECEWQSGTLGSAEARLSGLEATDIGLGPQDIQSTSAEIQSEIKAIQETLDNITTEVSLLKEASHPLASPLEERVSLLRQRVASLQSRLDDRMPTVGQAQLLLAEADARLRECEEWLVEHGKFADNQMIVEQLTHYQNFEGNQLKQAGLAIEQVNMAPLVGAEEAVDELNKRWEQIQQQTRDRLATLNAIADTVTEFDTAKSPLEQWVFEHQEYYAKLPLLETDPSELRKQKEEFEAARKDVVSQEKEVEILIELSKQFNKGKEPVQSLADRFARNLRKKRDIAASSKSSREPSDDSQLDMSLYEQSNLLKIQFDRYKEQTEQRIAQTDDLLDRLDKFERQHSALCSLIAEGNQLLDSEKPVGDTAQRIVEQTETCQLFRTKMSDHQEEVDAMLSLGRSVIGEHYTNPLKDTLSQKLTDFIQKWSNLELAWQNWYDELHSTGEHSQDLSDQFDCLKQALAEIEPVAKEILPASVNVETLESDLKQLQEKFDREVLCPLSAEKPRFESLSVNSHLLSNSDEVEQTLKEFKTLLASVEAQNAELSEMTHTVGCWWPEFVNTTKKLDSVEEGLSEDRPLAGSVPVVEEQDNSAQALLLSVEELKPKVMRCLKRLVGVASHSTVVRAASVTAGKDKLQHNWEGLYKEVEERRDHVELGRVRIKVYAECRDPFEDWLGEAEKKLGDWRQMEKGMGEQIERLKAFKMDVELHSHDMQSCESLGEKFITTTKAHQNLLLAYRKKVSPGEFSSRLMPEHFFDLESEGLRSPTTSPTKAGDGPVLHSHVYHNGLQVVSDDLLMLKKRFDKLKGRVERRTKRFEEAREMRLRFDDALDAFLPKIEVAEEIMEQLVEEGIGKSSKHTLKQQLDMMEKLETEYSALHLLLGAVVSAANELAGSDLVDSEDEGEEEAGGDVVAKEKAAAQQRYETLQEELRELREEVDAATAKAQAFQSLYAAFAGWLRNTERMIQQDDSLKLEANGLRSHLKYLQSVAADISAHEDPYTELYGRFQTALGLAGEGAEASDLTVKLDNLETRWSSLQVVHEDIEVIGDAISKLESFQLTKDPLQTAVEELLKKLKCFSPSAISSEQMAMREEEFEILNSALNGKQSEFQALLDEHGELFNTPFDQTKFQKSVDDLETKMAECAKIRDEKEKKLKFISSRLGSLEKNRSEFETWLGTKEEQLGSLTASLAEKDVNFQEQMVQAQKIQADVSDHEQSLESIDSLVNALMPNLDEDDAKELESQFANLSSRYQSVAFFSQSYPHEQWLCERTRELGSMYKCAVLVAPLQEQISETHQLQRHLADHSPEIEELENLSRGHPDQSDSSLMREKMAAIQTYYDKLTALANERGQVLTLFQPTMKLYAGSLESWEELLKKWEDSATSLSPPSLSSGHLQSAIDQIKSLQESISNHEPEFSALQREAQQMYLGPEDEDSLIKKMKGLPFVGGVVVPEARPGQVELQGELDEDKRRLDALKKDLSDSFLQLKAQLQNVIKFSNLIGGLLPWLQEHNGISDELKLTNLSYAVMEKQYGKCKVAEKEMEAREAQKDELAEVYAALRSNLASDSQDAVKLKEQYDELELLWSSLSKQLAVARSKLKPAMKIAKSHEGEKEHLTKWVQKTLSELTNLGPLPSEPQPVQELKLKIDGLKAEYNGLAPMLAKCAEEAQALSRYTEDDGCRSQMTGEMQNLQGDWDSVGHLLGDILQKLTEALVQTQEFQHVADNLEQWVSSMQNTLKQQELVAARVRLIEPQMEGLKPIVEDIKLNSATLKQVSTLGQQLISQANPEERLKVEKRLHALEMRFYALDKTSKKRMNDLEDALEKASLFEEQCLQLSEWMKAMEDKLQAWKLVPIRSQPLKAILEEAKEFNQEVSLYKDTVEEMSASESSLFATDLLSIQNYESQQRLSLSISELHRSPSPFVGASPGKQEVDPDSFPSQKSSSIDTTLEPEFAHRPGALEAIQVGAKLRKNYGELAFRSSRKEGSVNQCLQAVLSYESTYDDFSDWLNEQVAMVNTLGAVPVECDQLKSQIQVVKAAEKSFQNKQGVLESLNAKGTSLVDGCHDNLSRDSVEESLSELNEQWGNQLSWLDKRGEVLQKGASLAGQYERLQGEFSSWLTGCEEKLAKPVVPGASSQEIQQQLKSLETFLSDIGQHKTQLESTTAAGQELESFVTSANAELPFSAESPPDLGYHELQLRYEALKVLAYKRNGEMKESFEKARDLLTQLSAVLEQLYAVKAEVDKHEPPHLFPSDIQRQLENLGALANKWEELQPTVTSLCVRASEFSSEAENPLATLSNELAQSNKITKEQLDQWKAKLQSTLDAAQKFESGNEEITAWISGMQRRLDHEEGIRATVEGVQKQLEEAKALQAEVSQHQSTLQQLMDLGRGMMGGASPEDCILIGDRLAQVQAVYESLQRQAVGRIHVLQDGLKQASEFESMYNTLLDDITAKSVELEQMPAVGMDIETVEAQLKEYKEFETDVADMKLRVTLCQQKGRQIKESCYHGDKAGVEAKLEELTKAWNKLHTGTSSHKRQLEDALLRLGQFNEALDGLLSWIADYVCKLDAKALPGALLEDLESQKADMQSIQSDVVSREPSVASLNEVGKRLVSGSHDDGSAAEIQKDLTELNDRWESLKSLSADRQLKLSTALERARGFHSSWRHLQDQLNQFEEKTTSSMLLRGRPVPCQAELDKHQALELDVQGLKETISAFKSEGEGLKSQCRAEDQEMVNRWIGEVEQRWEDILAAVRERQTLLEEAKKEADKFEEGHVVLSDQLSQLEQAITGARSTASEADTVKKQLEEHKALLKKLEDLEGEVRELEGSAVALSKSCVQEDSDVIQGMLQQLRTQCDGLHTEALHRQSNLDEALLKLGQFEEAYGDLKAWLARALKQLQDLDPIPGRSDSVSALATKHKVLQKELVSHQPHHKSVVRAGRELVKSKTGEARSGLKRKLADLEQEWETVWELANARQQKLDEAFKKLRMLESQVGPIKAWMSKVLPSLDESEPVHGDTDTVHELITAHEAFQRELGSHQKGLDVLNVSCEQLVNSLVDQPQDIKVLQEELNSLWQDLCERSVSKQDRLTEAMQLAQDLDTGLREAWQWMDDKEMDLDMMSMPSENAGTLQQQIDQHKAFQQSVATYQQTYDEVMNLGRFIYQVCHPRAEQTLYSHLQQLEEKWDALKEKVGGRGEALASELLELDGLQQMLDDLWEWVEGAGEQQMTVAESLPVADDLDTIDQQLKDHEAFQEDMATKQPNMDALNKMAKRRKSRSSLTSVTPPTNPEMVRKINSVHKKWQRLWLRSSERHRQLLEARTRLRDIAKARSFNFDAWKKRFIAWVDQHKLRVRDLFQRFDNNHDGMLTREEFMKGLKASGLTMTQIETEKVADYFDHNRSGNIELSEIITVLKGPKSWTRPPTSNKPMTDAEKIDQEIQIQVSECACRHKFKVSRVGEGQYKFGDSQKLRMVRILRSNVMVRVGGGWETLKDFLVKNDPCRASGRTNADLRDAIVENLPFGLTTVGFRSKRQSATLQKNEEVRRLQAADSRAQVTTRTLPSGRQETTITRKSLGNSDQGVMEGLSNPPKMQRHYGSSVPKTVTSSPLHQPNSYSRRSETPTRLKHITPPREISSTNVTPPHGLMSSIPRPTTPANKQSSSQRSAIVGPTTPTAKEPLEQLPSSPDQPLFPKTPSRSSVVKTPGSDLSSRRSQSKIPLPSSSKRKPEGK